jgi:hypothetical protein
MTVATPHAQIPRGVRYALIPLGVIGLAGLLLTFWLGFEESNSWLLWLSAPLVLAAPLAVVLHLAWTRSLPAEKKRVWWNEFASAEIWSALSEYLSSSDLSAGAERRAREAQMRRRSPIA